MAFVKSVEKLSVIEITVPPESIDPFAAFLPPGLHASLTRYSRTQPRLYLGKTEDGIHPAAAAFWTRYYPGNKDASSLSSIFVSKLRDEACLILSLESLQIMSVTRLITQGKFRSCIIRASSKLSVTLYKIKYSGTYVSVHNATSQVRYLI